MKKFYTNNTVIKIAYVVPYVVLISSFFIPSAGNTPIGLFRFALIAVALLIIPGKNTIFPAIRNMGWVLALIAINVLLTFHFWSTFVLMTRQQPPPLIVIGIYCMILVFILSSAYHYDLSKKQPKGELFQI